MKIQQVLTGGLLMFVAVSLAFAVADVIGLRGQGGDPAPTVVPTAGTRVIVYYFHTTMRCPTCRTMESHAREAVAPQAEKGALEWRVVNFEEPADRHFATEFNLPCPSVVLVWTRDGQPVRWKSLERIWELNDDRSAFVDYVRTELTAFMEDRP